MGGDNEFLPLPPYSPVQTVSFAVRQLLFGKQRGSGTVSQAALS